MKKSVYSIITMFALVLSLGAFTSCREDKSAGEKVEDTMQDIGDDIEDGADDVKDEMDDMKDEVEDAVDDN